MIVAQHISDSYVANGKMLARLSDRAFAMSLYDKSKGRGGVSRYAI